MTFNLESLQKLDCLEKIEYKREIANGIIDDFRQLNEKIEMIITNFENEHLSSLETIDEYINQYKLLCERKYCYNGSIIDVNDLINYFNDYNDATSYLSDNIFLNDEYEFMYEGEDLENLLSYYKLNVLLVFFLKWNFQKHKGIASEIIALLKHNSQISVLSSPFPKHFWMENYTDFLDLCNDKELANILINIDSFTNDYSNYILSLTKKNDFINCLFSNEFLYSQVERNVTELELCRDINENIRGSLTNGKYSKEEASLILSDKELLYDYATQMTEDEFEITAKYAFNELILSLEYLNTIKIIFKEFQKNDIEYKCYYTFIKKLINKITELTKLDDYLDSSISENLKEKVCEFFFESSDYINSKLLMIIARDKLDDFIELKREITLLYKNKHPDYINEIEKNIDIVCEKISSYVGNDKSYEQTKEQIQNLFPIKIRSLLFNDHKVINTLTTAEVLYNRYIINMPVTNGFDYSVISCNYYKTIEILLNTLIYIPYKNSIGNNVTQQNIKKYFGNANCGYVNKNGVFELKNKIELGPIGHLLKNSIKNNNLQYFLQQTYGIKEYANIRNLSNSILKIKERRNNAVHDCNIPYNGVNEDKYIVYDINNEIEYVFEVHNLLKEIIQIFE